VQRLAFLEAIFCVFAMMLSQTRNSLPVRFKFSLLCEKKDLTAANLIFWSTFLFPGNDLELFMNSKELLGRNILIKDVVV